jgi:hypothetical protein
LAGPCRRDPRVVAKIILMRIGGICGLPPPDPPNPPNRPGSACTTVIVAWAGSMPIRPKPALTKVFGNNWLGGLGGLGGSDMGTLRHDYSRGAGEILRSGLGGSDRYRALKTPGVGQIL